MAYSLPLSSTLSTHTCFSEIASNQAFRTRVQSSAYWAITELRCILYRFSELFYCLNTTSVFGDIHSNKFSQAINILQSKNIGVAIRKFWVSATTTVIVYVTMLTLSESLPEIWIILFEISSRSTKRNAR